MAKTISCDKCGEVIGNSGYEIIDGFNKTRYDLCKSCYQMFKHFIATKAQA